MYNCRHIILNTECDFTHRVYCYTLGVILHTGFNFTQQWLVYTHSVISHTGWNFAQICSRSLVYAVLSRIYALSSVKFPHLKLRLCKKDDKYEVCSSSGVSQIVFSESSLLWPGLIGPSWIWFTKVSFFSPFLIEFLMEAGFKPLYRVRGCKFVKEASIFYMCYCFCCCSRDCCCCGCSVVNWQNPQ